MKWPMNFEKYRLQFHHCTVPFYESKSFLNVNGATVFGTNANETVVHWFFIETEKHRAVVFVWCLLTIPFLHQFIHCLNYLSPSLSLFFFWNCINCFEFWQRIERTDIWDVILYANGTIHMVLWAIKFKVGIMLEYLLLFYDVVEEIHFTSNRNRFV